jgi:hypothetical protein
MTTVLGLKREKKQLRAFKLQDVVVVVSSSLEHLLLVSGVSNLSL